MIASGFILWKIDGSKDTQYTSHVVLLHMNILILMPCSYPRDVLKQKPHSNACSQLNGFLPVRMLQNIQESARPHDT
jgi:hypothetical protein